MVKLVASPVIPSLGLGLAVALTLFIYWPGLSGGFLFDDIKHLESLRNIGGVQDSEQLIWFVFQVEVGGSGRPLALLSFLLDDNGWPAQAGDFLYTNLLLHVLNGVLCAWLALKLALLTGVTQRRAQWIALATAALWMLHPLQVSTTLYVIQRMNQLMALFVFAALVAYLHGRQWVVRKPLVGYSWMTASIVVGGLLATLSKENGALLPLYVIVIEATLLEKKLPKPPRWHWWASGFLYLPLVLMVGYMVSHWQQYLVSYENLRAFTPSQRLLTEARIIWDYLQQIFMPSLGGTGLYHDDYPISQSLWNPPQTLLAVVGSGALITTGFWLHRRWPVLAFGILWFFAGHLLESTVLPLELYFEHRNYVPMFGLLFAVGWLCLERLQTLPLPRLALMGSLLPWLMGGIFAVFTWHQATVWGNPPLLARIWAHEHPESSRSQQFAADFSLRAGNIELATSYLQQALVHSPENAGLQLQLLQLACMNDSATRAQIENLVARLPQSELDNTIGDTLNKLSQLQQDGACPTLTWDDIDQMVTGLMHVPAAQTPEWQSNLLYFQGKQFASRGLLTPAVETLDAAFAAKPNVDIALQQAIWLYSAGLTAEALDYVDKARQANRSNRWPLRKVRKKHIDHWANHLQRQRALPSPG